MHKFLLSTAAIGMALGLTGGLAAPAMAGNGSMADCQTQLQDVEQTLMEQDLPQTQMREIDREIQRAEQAIQNNNSRECMTIVSSLESQYLERDQMASADQAQWRGAEQSEQTVLRRGTSGERIIVDQPEPEVAVQQPAPRVRVQQVAPEISVTQAKPEVVVEEAQPKITVIQPPPQVIVEKAQPKVSVRVPEPEVGVSQEDVQVSVVQPEPNVSVEQGEPSIEIVEPEPQIVLRDGEPADVTVTGEEPQVRVSEQAAADVRLQQKEAEVSIRQAEPEVEVERVGEADIRYQDQQQQAQQQGLQQDQQMAQTETEAERLALTEPMAGEQAETEAEPMVTEETETDILAQEQTTTAGQVPGVVVASDVIGMNLTTIDGADVGEVEDIVYDATGEYYIVVTSGGFLGLGEQTRVVPMSRVSYGEDTLIVMSEADLQSGFDQTRFTSVEPDFEMEAGTL